MYVWGFQRRHEHKVTPESEYPYIKRIFFVLYHLLRYMYMYVDHSQDMCLYLYVDYSHTLIIRVFRITILYPVLVCIFCSKLLEFGVQAFRFWGQPWECRYIDFEYLLGVHIMYDIVQSTHICM
jgi:hypothetical protein